jgi:hypothetical protein
MHTLLVEEYRMEGIWGENTKRREKRDKCWRIKMTEER